MIFIKFLAVGKNFPLSQAQGPHYVWRMDQIAPKPLNALLIAALLAGAGLLSAAVFAGWMRFGADIVLTYAENGLSSCL